MSVLRTKKALLIFLLALLGIVDFATVSHSNISIFFRGYVAIIPLQVLALVYLIYSHRSSHKRSNRLD